MIYKEAGMIGKTNKLLAWLVKSMPGRTQED